MSEQEPLKEFRCLVCDRGLSRAVPDTLQASGGLTFRSFGNYGSHIYDPVHDEGRIVAWVCDECVTERIDRWVLEVPIYQRPKFDYRQLASIEDLP